MTIRVTCPACGKRVALTSRRRLWKHGQPTCPQSRRRLSRALPVRYQDRPVTTIPGPDTWNPFQGAA